MAKKYNKKKWYLYFILAVLLIILFFFIVILKSSNKIGLGTFWFSKINELVIFPANKFLNKSKDFLALYKVNELELVRKNQRLKRELMIKNNEVQELIYLKKINSYYKSLINYRSNVTYQTLVAKIVSYNPQNHFFNFWINLGVADGVRSKMPVIAFNKNGERVLIGFISKTGKKNSLIQTILDPRTYVGVLIETNDIKGILNGDPQGHMKISYLPLAFTNLVGERIVTSGIGKKYPEGIFIGNIIRAEKSLHGLFNEAIVKPEIDFSRLKDVIVIFENK